MSMVYKRQSDGTTYYWKDGRIFGSPTLVGGGYDVANEFDICDMDLTRRKINLLAYEVTKKLGDHSK